MSERIYDRENYEIDWRDSAMLIFKEIKGRTTDKTDEIAVENIAKGAANHSSIIFPPDVFENMFREDFEIIEKRTTHEWVFSESAPIYFIKKKQ
ncbi:hypothetical protein GF345_03115 [Candidatus Woesearchaeota archaeon]|nr:hypothetical protein [Candidatus Woesearchaeota archaeon]